MSEEFGITPRRTRPRSGAAPSRARRRPSTKLLTAKFAALSTAGALVIGGWLAARALGPKAAAKTKAAAATTATPLESTTATQSAASTASASSSQDQASSPAPVTTRAS
jgi:hypothetical protein